MLTENGQKWLTLSNPSFVISVSLPTELFVSIKSETKTKKEKKTNGNKIPSYLQSYKLFQIEGNTVEQIATTRNLAISTVETHLIDCVKHGLDLDVSRLGFNDYKLKFITNVINSIFWEYYSKIKPIKEECDRLTDIDCDDEKLPLVITYFDIKYTIALMGK
jgi:uncharacterized protein YpbB